MFDTAQLDFKIIGKLVHKNDNQIVLALSNQDIEYVDQYFKPLPLLDFIKYRKKRSLDCPLPNLNINKRTHCIHINMELYPDISTGMSNQMLDHKFIISGYITRKSRWVITSYHLFNQYNQPNCETLGL